MAIRRGWITVGAVVTSVVLLAGCSSGSNSAGTTSAASTSSAAESSAGALTTVGGDTSEFDAQTTTWFDTMCTGMAPLTDLTGTLTSAGSAADISAAMATIGTAFQDTAGQLSELPPPSFDGGDTLAQSVQTGLQTFGQTFADFSQRAAALQDGDTAALQQFSTDLQAELAQSPISQLDATPEVQQEIRKIPSCQPFFGT